MSRSRQPVSTFSIASTRPSSRKKSAGPPIPNDVRVASGSFSLIPERPCSQARLDALRQLIAQLADISGTHQKKKVVRTDEALQRLAGALEVADVGPVREKVRE